MRDPSAIAPDTLDGMQDRFPEGSFTREDESPDPEFYGEPRLVTHIDDHAIASLGEAYARLLPPDGEYLDLMGSWVSHYPLHFPIRRLVGLGMNADELRRNIQLSTWMVHDLNADPSLPFEDGTFDGVTVCVSVQYLIRPVEVFAEVGRVLKPGCPVIVSYSNRCFPTKAVRIWLALDDTEHARLIAMYMKGAGCFGDAGLYEFPPEVPGSDPLWVVVARRLEDAQ